MQASANMHYCCWLLFSINVFIPAGYLLALSLAPFDDWNDIMQGLPQPILWRAALRALGVALTLLALLAAAHDLAPFLPIQCVPDAGAASRSRWRSTSSAVR
jgi:hypothetical protein